MCQELGTNSVGFRFITESLKNLSETSERVFALPSNFVFLAVNCAVNPPNLEREFQTGAVASGPGGPPHTLRWLA